MGGWVSEHKIGGVWRPAAPNNTASQQQTAQLTQPSCLTRVGSASTWAVRRSQSGVTCAQEEAKHKKRVMRLVVAKR